MLTTREAAARFVVPSLAPVKADSSAVATSESSAIDKSSAIDESSPVDDSEPANWPDESAESSFLSEARERGETIAPAKARSEIADETDSKALPSLDELVQRIPPEIRETLEDLFRAKFTKVKRVPAKALKG
jgi:hypothetical protein